MSNGKKIMDVSKKPINKSDNRIISWSAPEFIQFKRSSSWYAILIIAGLALMTAFYFLEQNYLGMATVGLAVIVLILLSGQKPKIKKYSISASDISIEDKNIPISEFKSYFVTYINNIANLHLEKTKKFSAPVSMFIENDKEEAVLDVIGKILPENVKMKNTASDMFSNWFKF